MSILPPQNDFIWSGDTVSKAQPRGTDRHHLLFHMWRNFAYVNLHSGANDESTDMVSVILPPNQAPRQLDQPPHCSHGAMLPFIDPSRQCEAYGIWTLFQPCSAFRHVPQASPTTGISPRLPPRRNTAHSPIGAITPEQRIVTTRQIQRRRCRRRTHV
jgi:hypothetical protein